MKILPRSKRETAVHLLVEGMSLRGTSRLVDCSYNTILKLLVNAGEAAAEYHDRVVRNVRVRQVQCDEIWSFCYAKQKNVPDARKAPPGAGDLWTWTAFDRKSKLVLSYRIGDRSLETATEFMRDLKGRVASRFQLTTDAHNAYFDAVDEVFGADIDYSQLTKVPGIDPETKKPKVSQEKTVMIGNPDLSKASTSHVERQNLNMRMGMRRFTRKSNAFSKKVVNHVHMCSLYFLFYNFCRIHQTLEVTPALQAGIDDRLRDIAWIVDLIDARAPKPKRPRTYRKKPRPIFSD